MSFKMAGRVCTLEVPENFGQKGTFLGEPESVH